MRIWVPLNSCWFRLGHGPASRRPLEQVTRIELAPSVWEAQRLRRPGTPPARWFMLTQRSRLLSRPQADLLRSGFEAPVGGVDGGYCGIVVGDVTGTQRDRVRAYGETLQIPPVGWNRYPPRCHQEGIPATKQRRSISRYLGDRSRRRQNGRMLVPRVVRRVPEAFQAKDARPSSGRTRLPALLVVSFQVQVPDSAG